MESKFSVFGERGIGGKIGLGKRVERGSVNFGCGVQEIQTGAKAMINFWNEFLSVVSSAMAQPGNVFRPK